MRSGKPPTSSEGFSGAAGSHQLLNENASDMIMPNNLHSALHGVGGGGDQSSDEGDSPTKAQGTNNDDMYYDNN